MRHALLAANAGMLLAAVLFGASAVATRAVVDQVPPLSLAVFRFGIGGALVWICLLVAAPGLRSIRRTDLPLLALLGAILFALFPLTFNLGLRLTEASQGSMMLATSPVWSALLARQLRQEHLLPTQVAGVVLTMIGVLVALTDRGLHWNGHGRELTGDCLLIIAAMIGATYVVLVRRAYQRYAAVTVTAYGMVIGALALVPAALVEGLLTSTHELHGQTLALVLFLAIPGGALGWSVFALALTQLAPTQVAVYINLNPLTAMVLGGLLLDEAITAILILAFGIVLTGVLLVNWPRASGRQVANH